MSEAAGPPPVQWSEDGRHYWDGAQWVERRPGNGTKKIPCLFCLFLLCLPIVIFLIYGFVQLSQIH